MEDNIDCDLAKEVLTVLEFCDDEVISKIPDYVIRFISSNAALSNKEFYLVKNKELAEQNISNACKDYLAMLYLTYLEDESKQDLLEKWINNDE